MSRDAIWFSLYVGGMFLLWACTWRLRLLRRERDVDERTCSFTFSAESWETLKTTAEGAERTPAQELQYALALLDVCRTQNKAGGKILLIDASGTTQELRV